jgi:CDP-diacylglycerol---glycerol-3-phosphate 3-phosphatidyltransferase
MANITTASDPGRKARLLVLVPNVIILGFHQVANWLAGNLARFHVSPNTVSLSGFVVGVAAGVLFALDHPVWAGALVIASGVLDIVDGRVAVNSKKKSLTGAIFDSTLDRYSEFFIYFGIAVHFQVGWRAGLPFFAFLGSSMVSYTRARAEGLGIDCRIGLMQRAERITLISIGALAGGIFRVFDIAMVIALGAIALVSNFTAFQRVYHVRKIETQMKKGKEA